MLHFCNFMLRFWNFLLNSWNSVFPGRSGQPWGRGEGEEEPGQESAAASGPGCVCIPREPAPVPGGEQGQRGFPGPSRLQKSGKEPELAFKGSLGSAHVDFQGFFSDFLGFFPFPLLNPVFSPFPFSIPVFLHFSFSIPIPPLFPPQFHFSPLSLLLNLSFSSLSLLNPFFSPFSIQILFFLYFSFSTPFSPISRTKSHLSPFFPHFPFKSYFPPPFFLSQPLLSPIFPSKSLGFFPFFLLHPIFLPLISIFPVFPCSGLRGNWSSSKRRAGRK